MALGIRGGEGVAVTGGAGGGGDFGAYTVVRQCNGVVTWRRGLAVVAEAASVAVFRQGGCPRVETQSADSRHQQHVSEVRVAGAAQMGVGEAGDGVVAVAVSCAEGVDLALVFAGDIVRYGVGVRTDLHSAERHAGSREGVAHSVGADEWIDV